MKTLPLFILVIFSMLFFTSCDFSCAPEFDGSERYHTIGKIVDKAGQPIPNMYLQIIGCKEVPFLNTCDGDSYCAIAAVGKTDAKGNFNTLYSQNTAHYYYVLLNPLDKNKINTRPSPTHNIRSVDIKVTDHQNYFLDLGEIEY